MRTPLSTLSREHDLTPRDVLREALLAGVRVFWHEGRMFLSPRFLHDWIRFRMAERWPDPVPELQISAEDAEKVSSHIRAQEVTSISVTVPESVRTA